MELEHGLEVEDEEMIKEQLRQDKNLPVDAGAVRGQRGGERAGQSEEASETESEGRSLCV